MNADARRPIRLTPERMRYCRWTTWEEIACSRNHHVKNGHVFVLDHLVLRCSYKAPRRDVQRIELPECGELLYVLAVRDYGKLCVAQVTLDELRTIQRRKFSAIETLIFLRIPIPTDLPSPN